MKIHGKANDNYLSFPLEGFSLAMDFKNNDGILELFQEIDTIVEKFNGRIYLAKDAVMTKQVFNKTYKEAIEKFKVVREKYGKGIQSNLSKRLGL